MTSLRFELVLGKARRLVVPLTLQKMPRFSAGCPHSFAYFANEWVSAQSGRRVARPIAKRRAGLLSWVASGGPVIVQRMRPPNRNRVAVDRAAERAGTYPSNRAQASGRLADLLKQS